MERIYNLNEDGKKLVEMENKICDFASRLEEGKYKVILYNNQTPVLAGDLGLVEFIISDLTEESKVELKENSLVIHNEDEIIELKGRKRMSDGEIFARQYLDECEYTGTLIIKDSPEQIEFREDNIHEAKDFYSKTRDIICIRQFIQDESETYRMNWDALWMTYRNGSRELWQRG